MNAFHKYYRWTVPIFFIMMLLFNFLSSFGVILPATQAEISDKYVNLVAPAGITFSIWSVIYLGMAAVVSIDFINIKNQEFVNHYRVLIQPRMLEWMALNILWLITWSYEWILVSLIVLLLYTSRIMNLTAVISRTPALRIKPWLLKFPMGLHLGWLLVASMANLTTYLVSLGVDGTGLWGIVWAAGILVVVLALSAYYYMKFGNEMLMIPALWTLVGVFIKQSPMFGFVHSEVILMYISVVLFIIGMVAFISLFRLQKEQRQQKTASS